LPLPEDYRPSPLPYPDAKPVGAADFYFAINATFRFIAHRLGIEGLRRYWTDLGREYARPVSTKWKHDGLDGVAAYWRAFFRAEPGAEVEVTESTDRVEIEVRVCPAIAHLRQGGRTIFPQFCQHCYYQEEAMAAAAGMAMRLEGGNGSCRHTYRLSRPDLAAQDPNAIAEAS